jgi:hypothetical protein
MGEGGRCNACRIDRWEIERQDDSDLMRFAGQDVQSWLEEVCAFTRDTVKVAFLPEGGAMS